MRRPFAVIGAAFFLTLLTLDTLPQGSVWIVGALAAVFWLLCFCIRRLRREPVGFVLSMTVLAACAIFVTQTVFSVQPILALDGQTVQITAHISQLPQSLGNGRARYGLRSDTIDGESLHCELEVYSADGADANLTDAFVFTAKVSARDEHDGSGVYLHVDDVRSMVRLPDRGTVRSYTLRIRRYIASTLRKALPGTPGAVLTAMLIGDKSAIPSDVYAAMRRSGVAHIFSISGFHLSVFALSLLHALEKRRVPRQIYVPVCAGMVLFVMAVTGFPLSCIRAGLMIFLMLIGKLLMRQADSLNSLGFAVLMICAVRPLSAEDVGLQLSILGTLGVILGSPFAEKTAGKIRIRFRPLCRLCRMLCSAAIVSACIGILTMPVTIFAFGTVSVVAPLTNACILFAAQWAMILGSLSVAASVHLILSPIFHPLMLLSGLLTRYCTFVSGRFGNLKFAAPRVDSAEAGFWIAGTLILAASALLLQIPRRRAVRRVSALSLAILAIYALFSAWSMRDVVQIEIPDVGNNAAVIVRSRGKTALIGCGGTQTSNYVFDRTDHLDLVVLPDMRTSVSGAAKSVIRKIPTDTLALPERNYQNQWFYFFFEPQPLGKPMTLGGAEIEVCADPDAPAALLRIGDAAMLMLFLPGCDLSRIPQDWFGANVLYVCGDVPPALQAERFGYVLVQAQAQRTDAIVRRIVRSGGQAAGAGTYYLQDGGLFCRKEVI